MSIGSSIDNISRKALGLAKGSGEKVLESGKAIFNDATEESIKNSRGILGTIAQTRHGVEGVVSKGDYKAAAKNAFGDGKGGVDWGQVAGSYIGASAAYRVVSGGGLTRDKNGNPNVIGIPFV